MPVALLNADAPEHDIVKAKGEKPSELRNGVESEKSTDGRLLAAVNLALYLVFAPSPSVIDRVDDGHDLCPTCLGRDHLVEALSKNPCMNCSFMPRSSRVARLAQLCPQDDADLPPSGQVAHLRCSKRRGETTVSVPPSRRKRERSDQGLATRVEQLSTELAEMKSLLQTRHSDASIPTAGLSSPPMPDLSVEEDVLSLAASASQFRDEEEVQSSQASETD
ncbi:hypothetical protein GOODEAATRI_001121 [Goodea atripinnis]|uniref:Uncharacterized protein n=1 Tax=Goodea atripinnis TaxID=208336 RepID=A0ABV0ME26_9TELE